MITNFIRNVSINADLFDLLNRFYYLSGILLFCGNEMNDESWNIEHSWNIG